MTAVCMTTGYAYELDGSDWKSSPDDSWDIVMAVSSDIADARLVGGRRIDGSLVRVFQCADGTFRAQTQAAIG